MHAKTAHEQTEQAIKKINARFMKRVDRAIRRAQREGKFAASVRVGADLERVNLHADHLRNLGYRVRVDFSETTYYWYIAFSWAQIG